MSIHGNFNENRMVERTYETIDKMIGAYEKRVASEHQSIGLNPYLWHKLQTQLTDYVAKQRRIYLEGGYTDAAQSLQTLEDIAIRAAVEEFRGRLLDDPSLIHDDAAWEEFRGSIRDYEYETSR
jgi:hypothetical protein